MPYECVGFQITLAVTPFSWKAKVEKDKIIHLWGSLEKDVGLNG